MEKQIALRVLNLAGFFNERRFVQPASKLHIAEIPRDNTKRYRLGGGVPTVSLWYLLVSLGWAVLQTYQEIP